MDAWRALKDPRIQRRVSIALAAAIVPSIFATGFSSAHEAVVTGHSTFVNDDSYDPCLASIVGIMRLRVYWFNDMVLVERYNGDGSYIYAVEHGAPDPRDKKLVHSGVFYDFIDPNGAHWHIDEAYWLVNYSVNNRLTGDLQDNPLNVVQEGQVTFGKYHTWIVKVGRARNDGFRGDDPHTLYNFVNIVNTCKMHNTTRTFAGDVLHSGDNLTKERGHPDGAKPHSHGSFFVDLWVGKAPVLAPVGEETPSTLSWEAAWASGYVGDPKGSELPPQSGGGNGGGS